MFVTIKHQNRLTDGPRLLHWEIQLVNENCSEDERKVALKTIQDNAWFAHPENIIVAMCGKSHLVIFC